MSTNQEGESPSPSTIDQEWETHIASFPGFADLSTPKGRFVQSSKFIRLGREWCVWIYPRGDGATPDESQVSVYLALSSPGILLKFEYGLAIGGLTKGPAIHEFTALIGSGYRAFSTRNEILNHLVDGTLMVKVKMRCAEASLPFVPNNPATCDIVKKMFMHEEFADIVFEIGGEQLQSPSLFPAHRLILKMAAPKLEELCVTSNCVVSDQTPKHVQILDTSPDTFKALLMYIYGCEIPYFCKEIARTKEIIEASDKYGVTNLKLQAEAHYASSVQFNLENIGENFLFAEARNCALLKERVMNFMVNNAVEIVEKKALKDPPPGLNDALTALAMKEKKTTSKRGNEPMTTMPICELRRRAQEKGVDVDGTREMLMTALNQD